MAIGIDTSARGEGSFAEGISTTAYGKYSHTEGEGSSASGMASHAEGSGTLASNVGAHAEGANTKATGYGSHAEGSNTIASIESQHVEGKYNIDDTTAIHVVGNGTSNSERSNAHTLNLNGEAWFAGDIYTGSTSGTHKDEGSKKLLTEDDIDTLNQAITNKADKTSLIVLDEPIIINLTLESNEVYTLSTPIELIEKEIWHCESYCVSDGVEYHDFGLGRVLNDGNGNLSISFLNGCGVLTNTTLTNGNRLANTFTISKVLEYNKTPNYLIDQTEGTLGVSSGKYSHAEGHSTTAVGSCSHAEGQTTIAMGNWSHTEGKETSALNSYGHAEGLQTLSDGQTAHAEGAKTKAIGTASHAEGYLSAASFCAHAEGYSTSAEGDFAHAEGDTTIASGVASHAEGTSGKANQNSELIKTTASGVASHAEGVGTQATEEAAHSEGSLTIASGYASHAEGCYTIAAGDAQHVEGIANIEDTESKYIHITGNGAWDARSNAYHLDWDGNAWFAGDVYVGSTSGTNKDEGSKKLATQEYVDIRVPAVTASDNGKFLRIVNGTPAWATVDSAEGVSF